MPFTKDTPGPGRPKGSKNVATKTLKDLILGSLDRLGGIEYLVWLARENPGAYANLIGKVLPLQVTGANNGPLQFEDVTPARDLLESRILSLTARSDTEEGPLLIN